VAKPNFRRTWGTEILSITLPVTKRKRTWVKHEYGESDADP
jgi:hypothetical protein